MLLDAAAAAVSIAASGHLDKDGMGALPEPIDGNDGVAAAGVGERRRQDTGRQRQDECIYGSRTHQELHD